MNKTCFKLCRGVLGHDVLDDGSPLSKREAWIWLIEHAAWEEHYTFTIDEREYHAGRGELVVSMRMLAEAWRWSKSSVHRFLAQLKNAKMVSVGQIMKRGPGHLLSHISICNYSKYQDENFVTGTERGTIERTYGTPLINVPPQNGQSPFPPHPLIPFPSITTPPLNPSSNSLVHTDRNENSEDYGKKEGDAFPSGKASCAKETKELTKEFEQWWIKYPRKVAKAKAKAAYIAARRGKKVAAQTMLDGLDRYLRSDTVQRGFVCHATTWLHQERWNDEPENPGGGSGGIMAYLERQAAQAADAAKEADHG